MRPPAIPRHHHVRYPSLRQKLPLLLHPRPLVPKHHDLRLLLTPQRVLRPDLPDLLLYVRVPVPRRVRRKLELQLRRELVQPGRRQPRHLWVVRAQVRRQRDGDRGRRQDQVERVLVWDGRWRGRRRCRRLRWYGRLGRDWVTPRRRDIRQQCTSFFHKVCICEQCIYVKCPPRHA